MNTPLDIDALVAHARTNRASDLLLTTDEPPRHRVDGDWAVIEHEPLRTAAVENTIRHLTHRARPDAPPPERIPADDDLAFEATCGTRLRVNVFRHRGRPGIALRLIPDTLPPSNELGLPPSLMQHARAARGLILVAGATGHGKSTTLAKIVEYINHNQPRHIVTIEDPIEFVHDNAVGVVHQRQIGLDTSDYATGLRAALRQSPDVILIGELRDPAAISVAITAAETGHLVLGTIHTRSSADTIDRIIDAYPAYQQHQIRNQLSDALRVILTQVLLPKIGGGRALAYELMVMTPAVANAVREGKPSAVNNAIHSGRDNGMLTLEASLAELHRKRLITMEHALTAARSRENLHEHLTQRARA